MPQRADEMSMTVKRSTSAKLDELVDLCRSLKEAQGKLGRTYRYVTLDMAIANYAKLVSRQLEQEKNKR